MSRFQNTHRVVSGGLTLAAINSGGTQIATEVDGTAVDTHLTGLRFRQVSAAVVFDQASGTSHKFGWRGNYQSRKTTSGTGSTWADFGTTWADYDNTVSGLASGVATYVYQSDPADIPAGHRYVRLQYIPKAFIATSEALSTATGGVADITPLLLLSDPNRLPADAPV